MNKNKILDDNFDIRNEVPKIIERIRLTSDNIEYFEKEEEEYEKEEKEEDKE